MIDRVADAQLANAVLAAEDAYAQALPGGSGAPITAPPLDTRLCDNWHVAGLLVARDSLWRKSAVLLLRPQTVFYGWLLRAANPQVYLCVIRGTDGVLEWAEDAEGLPISVPGIPGRVESGFRGIYASMTLRLPGSDVDLPLVAAIASIVGDGRIMVAGHSLGAPLALSLASDLAAPSRLGTRVSLRAFASPHPGDGEYVRWASARLADCIGYAAPLDIVTHVPWGIGYASLPDTVELPTSPPGYRIELNPAAQHHLTSYILRLDPTFDLASLAACDLPYVSCIRRVSTAA